MTEQPTLSLSHFGFLKIIRIPKTICVPHSLGLLCVQLLQSCPTLRNPMDCSLPGSMEFSRQERWSGSSFPTPGDLPEPGIKPVSLASRALAGGLHTTSAAWA